LRELGPWERRCACYIGGVWEGNQPDFKFVGFGCAENIGKGRNGSRSNHAEGSAIASIDEVVPVQVLWRFRALPPELAELVFISRSKLRVGRSVQIGLAFALEGPVGTDQELYISLAIGKVDHQS
jgi:hypothetical protein